MIRRPPRSTLSSSSAASDVYERLGAPRAVGLHPAVLGDREAVQQLGEVLHHVVALGLPVHQHVEAQSLLQGDRRGDRPAGATGLRRSAVRARRISGVCGKDPMVVVVNGGSGSASAWAARRRAYGPRCRSASVSAATRSRTSDRRTPLAAARSARAARVSSSAPTTASGPVRKAVAKVTTSVTFWSANASQDRTCGSRAGSSATSCGTCCRDVAVATATSLQLSLI